MKRGDIYWVELPAMNGHEQVGRRPALLLQDDHYAGSLPVVLVAPLTGATSASRFPGTLLIEPTEENGLSQSSVVLVFQLRAVDRNRLREQAGAVSGDVLDAVYYLLDQLMGRAMQSTPTENAAG